MKKFELEEVTPKRVKELFNLLNNSGAEDLNGLSNKVIKMSKEALVLPITYLINQCICTNKWPNKWKLSKIVPLYKNKGDRTDVSNFRPVALLSPISKIVEKEIQLQMNEHMNKFGMWNKDMNAYRENYSTISAMIDIMETWTENIDDSFQNLSIFLDLSSAFDCVSASVLVDKMSIYGFGPNTCALLSSYLTHRSQAVIVGGEMSEFKANCAGVPQGSILGPILFNLYCNELPSMCHLSCNHKEGNKGEREKLFGVPCKFCGRFVSFADDSTIVFRGTKGEDRNLSIKIDKQLLKVEEFLASNNLKLNISKTQILRTASRQQHAGNMRENIVLEAKNDKDEHIVPANSAKILGVIFSKNLIWKEYIESGKDAMVGRLKRKLGALKFAGKFSSFKSRLKLANGCIMSIIIYGIQVWGIHCKASVLSKVQSVQLNTLKWVTGKYHDSLRTLLRETGWLSVYQLAIYHSVLLLWKVRWKGNPARLLRRIRMAEHAEARLSITDRVWSRTAVRFYKMVEHLLEGVQRVSEAKNILRKWVKSNVPLKETS